MVKDTYSQRFRTMIPFIVAVQQCIHDVLLLKLIPCILVQTGRFWEQILDVCDVMHLQMSALHSLVMRMIPEVLEIIAGTSLED